MITRPLRLEDLPAVLSVRVAVEEADRLPIRTPIDELQEELTDEGVDLDQDTVGLFSAEACVAYGWVQVPAEPTPQGWSALVHVAVHPDHTGRGHGRRLLEQMESRGRERLLVLPDPPQTRYLRTYAHDTQSRASQIAEHAGYTIERYYDDMTVELATRPPVAPTTALQVIPWDAAHAEAARLVKNEAFSEHWGSAPTSAESWARTVSPPRFQPDLSTLALDGDRVVGVVLSHIYEEDWPAVGREESLIGIIAVARSHRRQGVASAMVDRSLAAAAAHGLTHTTLGVDTANASGAHDLYASLGFVTTSRLHMWTKPVTG